MRKGIRNLVIFSTKYFGASDTKQPSVSPAKSWGPKSSVSLSLD